MGPRDEGTDIAVPLTSAIAGGSNSATITYMERMPDTSAKAFLVQLLLPVRDNEGREFHDQIWEALKDKLAGRYGGVTAYRRSPAEGVWAPSPEHRAAEDMFVVEVMTQSLDEAWWGALQAELQDALRQQHVVVRALPFIDIRQQT